MQGIYMFGFYSKSFILSFSMLSLSAFADIPTKADPQADIQNTVATSNADFETSSKQVLRDANRSVRLIVKLKEKSVISYKLELQKQQGINSSNLQFTQMQKFSKTLQTHQQKISSSQASLVKELKTKHLATRIHRKFIQLNNSINISAKAKDVESIRKLPFVAEVYPDNQVSAYLNNSVPVTGANLIWAMRDAKNELITGKNITVAIIDTGIDHFHPDLGGCLGANCKVVLGRNFIDGDNANDAMDRHGHGTHVAGIVAANGVLKGVAPDAKLYALKVLDDSGSGFDSSIIAAMEYALDPDGDPLTDDKVDIINMSLGSLSPFNSPVSEAANKVAESGVVVVVAAGNSADNFTVGAPGNAEKVLTVGATDNLNKMADFSSRGPVKGASFIKPEVVAPGVEINSTAPEGKYRILSGTSMASPHVAGGAALLKQLHPNLSSAEIKSLLISSAQKIDDDVFSQGAGKMDLVAAASSQWIFSNSLVDFGFVDIEQTEWKSTKTLTIKNISNNPIVINKLNSDTFPNGTTILASNNANIVLNPNQAETVDLELSVDNETLTFPDNASLHHERSLQFSSGSENHMINTVLFKAAKLNLNFGTEKDAALFSIYDENGKLAYTGDYDCDSKPDVYEVNLKPGTYKGLWFLSDDDTCFPGAVRIYKDNIMLTDKADLTIDKSEATHSIDFGDIINQEGQANKISTYDEVDSCGMFYIPGILNDFMFSCSITPFRMNSLPDDFSMSLMYMVRGKGEDINSFYLIQDQINGLNENHTLNLDLRAAGKVIFNYADSLVLKEGARIGMNSQSARNGTLLGSSFTAIESLDKPTPITLYSELSTLEPSEWHSAFRVYNPEEDEFFSPAIFETGNIAFPDKVSIMKVNQDFNNNVKVIYQSDSNVLNVTDSGYYASGRFYFDKQEKIFILLSSQNCLFCFGFQQDEQRNIFSESTPYQLSCDNELLEEDTTDGFLFSEDEELQTCDKLTLDLQMPTRFLGKEDVSDIRINLSLNSTPADSASNFIRPPIITDLVFLNDDKPSRVLDGEVAKFKIRLEDDHDADDLALTLSYRLDDSNWVSLPLQKNQDEYVAELLIGSGSHLGSLLLKATDIDNNSVEQTLNNIFVIGNEGRLQRLPQFGTLSEISVEATSALTSLTLEKPQVADPLGAVLEAKLLTPGPFRLGRHELIWEAENNIGKKQVTQILTVVDTIPPVMVAPPNINVESSKKTIVVELGVPVVFDAVDGSIVAAPDKTGPFGVGTHNVVWTSTDLSGNKTTAIQTVTVTKAESSGGGGNIGLLLIALLALCIVPIPRNRV